MPLSRFFRVVLGHSHYCLHCGAMIRCRIHPCESGSMELVPCSKHAKSEARMLQDRLGWAILCRTANPGAEQEPARFALR